MAIYRNVSMNFWTDSKIVDDFTPEDRYFYLYLVTNPHTTLSGCYEISARQMSNEIGYTREAVENLIKRFQTVHKVICYSVDTKEILLLNWHKYNWSKSDKFIKAVVAEMERIKEPAFKQYLMDVIENGDSEIRYPIDTVSAENFNDGYGMDTTVTVTVSDTVTDTVSVTVPETIPATGTVTAKRGVKGGEIVDGSSLSEPVKEKLIDFLAYRVELKKPFKSERGIKSLVAEAEKQEQKNGSVAVIDCIDLTMRNGWQGIIWEKIKKPQDMSREDAVKYLESGGSFFGDGGTAFGGTVFG